MGEGEIDNLLRSPAGALPEELVDVLLRGDGVRVERIVSRGHSSPPGFWYEQDEGEWVLLLAGRARLRLADEPRERELVPGDHVWIPARCRHRVEWTDRDGDTIWLAIFLTEQGGPPP